MVLDHQKREESRPQRMESTLDCSKFFALSCFLEALERNESHHQHWQWPSTS
ncbi:hypothetical protein A2U01_0106814, partial [Trifolium medium]|nr:hypothetical protein [Trifolium medium]